MQDPILRGSEVKTVGGLVQLAETGNLPDHNTTVRTAVNLLDYANLHGQELRVLKNVSSSADMH